MGKPLPMEVISSTLLTQDELGTALAGLTVTIRASLTGVVHSPRCRQVGKKAEAEKTMTVGELRAAGDVRPCRTCGGAIVEKLSHDQTEQLEALVPILEARREQMREAERKEREEQDRIRRADMIDERAHHIVHRWDWKIEEEKRTVGRYPTSRRIAAVPCTDCEAEAVISFDPRSLDVSYRCQADPEHGFVHLNEESLAIWQSNDENKLIALGLVAPVLAGRDDAWTKTYATRVDDYRATVSALEAFDEEHPPPLRLVPDRRCGDCSGTLRLGPRATTGSQRIEAHYSCENRHADGKSRRHEQSSVDERVDRILHRRLRDHPSWATAAELEPSREKVAAHFGDLTKKTEIFDAHIGAAKSVDQLVKIRSRLVEELELVREIHERGGLAAAGLTRYAAGAPYVRHWTFTDLARAFLTRRIEVTGDSIKVVTVFEDGTPFQRLLRSREIRAELAELSQRQEELERELADLDRE
ncbi:hypothetical protein [Actinomadura rupiterrae]|uniref:hypothetical protein n=1 Tax=Actinomadura rupiterrae TaxID=559627 RepID=UPI0020A2EDA9|nr:hypothetical protein [Actinomadura rupiterrae]MCP2342988.1 hypothetical protein [Actinomadura rupiterrae]